MWRPVVLFLAFMCVPSKAGEEEKVGMAPLETLNITWEGGIKKANLFRMRAATSKKLGGWYEIHQVTEDESQTRFIVHFSVITKTEEHGVMVAHEDLYSLRLPPGKQIQVDGKPNIIRVESPAEIVAAAQP